MRSRKSILSHCCYRYEGYPAKKGDRPAMIGYKKVNGNKLSAQVIEMVSPCLAPYHRSKNHSPLNPKPQDFAFSKQPFICLSLMVSTTLRSSPSSSRHCRRCLRLPADRRCDRHRPPKNPSPQPHPCSGAQGHGFSTVFGFIERRLYLFPDFFDEHCVERSPWRGHHSGPLNDDVLGRTLDAIAAYGPTEVIQRDRDRNVFFPPTSASLHPCRYHQLQRHRGV